jgi:hypothetical protein
MSEGNARSLPAAELDDYEQFAARIGVSKRSIYRLVDNGLPVIEIGRLRRIDPIIGMAWIRGELPPPEPPRRGRPRKATASPTAATTDARPAKLRLRHRTQTPV